VHPDRWETPARGEVALYEVWCPELHEDLDEKPEDGYTGTLYTIGCAKGQNYEQPYLLRPPRPYYGPEWGPYNNAAFLVVQDLPGGLSPTIGAEAQLRDLAATSRALLANARNHKTMTAVPADDPTAIAAAQAEGRYVIPFKGDPDRIKALEIGGVTQQQLLHFDMKAQTLDRVLGMADVQRGLVSGQGTASEVLTAQAASDIRSADVVQIYHNHVADIERTRAWYCYHDDRYVASVEGIDVPLPQPIFQGGKTEGLTFEDLDLEIEPYSMEHESPAARQQRTANTIEIVNWLAQTIPAAPWMPWHDIIPEIVEDAGIKEAMEGMDIGAAVAWASEMAGFQSEGQPERPAVSSMKQKTGGPINVRIDQNKTRGAMPQGQNRLPQRTGAGGFSMPGQKRNGAR
jgi:hypothetical protein